MDITEYIKENLLGKVWVKCRDGDAWYLEELCTDTKIDVMIYCASRVFKISDIEFSGSNVDLVLADFDNYIAQKDADELTASVAHAQELLDGLEAILRGSE